MGLVAMWGNEVNSYRLVLSEKWSRTSSIVMAFEIRKEGAVKLRSRASFVLNVRQILEAFAALDEKGLAITDGTDGIDVKADCGNDMMMLHSLQESFEKRAVQEFGPYITNFYREPVQVSTTGKRSVTPTHNTTPGDGQRQYLGFSGSGTGTKA